MDSCVSNAQYDLNTAVPIATVHSNNHVILYQSELIVLLSHVVDFGPLS